MQKLSISEKKLLVTNEMLKTFPVTNQHDLRTAFIKWWINSRKNGGLRLSSAGFAVFKNMEYTIYQFSAKNIATSANLLALDQHLECPYYIDGLGCIKSTVFVMGGKEATLINLYGGFNEFLSTLR